MLWLAEKNLILDYGMIIVWGNLIILPIATVQSLIFIDYYSFAFSSRPKFSKTADF